MILSSGNLALNNGVESIRSIIAAEPGTIPILVESGNASNPASFNAADIYAQIWLENVMDMEPDQKAKSWSENKVDRNYYVETHALYHPDVKPEDYSHLDEETLQAARNDRFVLIRDRHSVTAITGWSDKARQVLNNLAESDFSKTHLNNFVPIKKGDILAIGQNIGLEIRSPGDGVVLMVGASSIVESAFRETFANIGITMKVA